MDTSAKFWVEDEHDFCVGDITKETGVHFTKPQRGLQNGEMHPTASSEPCFFALGGGGGGGLPQKLTTTPKILPSKVPLFMHVTISVRSFRISFKLVPIM